MSVLGWVVLILFLLISSGYVLFAIILFYHVGRYSYIGDASKRVFAAYAAMSAAVIVLGALVIAINHLVGG